MARPRRDGRVSAVAIYSRTQSHGLDDCSAHAFSWPWWFLRTGRPTAVMVAARLPEEEGGADDGDGGERHGGAGEHRRQVQVPQRVEDARGHRDPDQLRESGARQKGVEGKGRRHVVKGREGRWWRRGGGEEKKGLQAERDSGRRAGRAGVG
eukprot:620543-Pleurochrysis_carterae.AAC.2